MNIEIIWLVIMAISIPLAGIIGFWIQQRRMKNLRLENERLTLDNSTLRAAQLDVVKPFASPINIAGHDTQRVDDISQSEESIEEDVEDFLSNIDWRDKLIQIGTLFLLCYFLYDIYRLGTWLYSLI